MMTNYELLDDLCQDCTHYPCYALRQKDMCYQKRKLTEELEKHEEYEWHYEPEGGWTPDTLPKVGSEVLVKTRIANKCGVSFRYGYNIMRVTKHGTWSKIRYGIPVAWTVF